MIRIVGRATTTLAKGARRSRIRKPEPRQGELELAVLLFFQQVPSGVWGRAEGTYFSAYIYIYICRHLCKHVYVYLFVYMYIFT